MPKLPRGISRIDGPSGHHYYARNYTKKGVVPKTFSDGVYGSPAAALRAATKWLDGMRARFAREDMLARRLPFVNRPTKQNRSGVVGVYRSFQQRRGCRRRYYWYASIPNKRLKDWPRTKGFSIEEYGERDAKRQAEAYRKAWEKEIVKLGGRS